MGIPAVSRLLLCVAVLSGPSSPRAAEEDVGRLLERLERLERTVAEQQETIRGLKEALAAASPAAAPSPPASELAGQLAAELGAAAPAAPEAPSPPVPARAPAGAYANLSLDGLFAAGASTEPDVPGLEPGGHDPAQRGFTVQNVEMVLDGAIDPYLRGQANVVLQIDPEGETSVELEEVYATTTSLPFNLQVKAGHFFTEFGRLNATHPHTWDFVNQPLVNARLFGGDGLRAPGARVSWLMPLPFFSELSLAVQNSGGETATSFRSVPGEVVFGRTLLDRPVRGASDLLVTPHWSTSFDLSDTQTVLLGASGAFGPNASGDDGRTEVYGLDAFWKWKAADADKGFPFMKVQAEAMRRSWRAAASATDPEAVFEDEGAYAQAAWGFRPRWVATARWDRVSGDRGISTEFPEGDPSLQARSRASTALTFFPSEFSKWRLQVDRDLREIDRDATSVWLQFEFLLGAHGAHKF